jgi:tryptophan synthase alpha chain
MFRLNRTKKLLCCGLVVGDPHIEGFIDSAHAIAEAGADVVEWILPLPEAAYHGRVLQRAAQRALKEPVSLSQTCDAAAVFVKQFEVPLVLTTYYARILVHGLERFASELNRGGFSALMVPDLPIEECEGLRAALAAHGIALVQSLGQDPARRELIAEEADGFLLWAAHAGGDQVTRLEEIGVGIEALRSKTDLPIFVASHIQSAEDAHAAWAIADGVMVGSSIVWLIEGKGPDIGGRLKDFVSELANAR